MQQKGFWGGGWERSAVGMVMKGGTDCEDAPLCVSAAMFSAFFGVEHHAQKPAHLM